VPSPATTAQETAHTVTTHTVTVRAGDTLWGIAKRTYDDSKDWPRIYEANEADIDDPHWIYPGETLVIPAAPSDDTDHTGRPSGPGHRNDQQSPTESAEPAEPAKAVKSAEPSTTTSQVPSADPTKSTEPTKSTIVSSPASTASPTTAPATPKVDASESSGQGQTTIAIHALLGGGGLLAAGLLATYVARRRTQSRQRGVGRVGAKVPEELLAEARQIHLAGSSTGDAAQFLDEALRELAEMTERAGGRLPEVAAARIDEDRLLLRITPADTAWIDGPIPFVSPLPPAPWVVSRDGTEWSLSRSHLPARFDRVAPYPCLVTLGMDDVGGTWLLDLESAGVTEVSGDPERAIEVLRFIAAELAINSWSDVEMAGIYGIGEEVAAINPGRLMTEPQPRIDDLTRIARHAQEADESQDGVLRTRVVDGSRGAWMPVVLLAALDSGNASPGVEYAEEVRGFADALAGASGRSGAALVMVERAHSAWPDDETSPAQINLQVDERGRMHTPFGVLTANRMSADDAAALAGLLADADDLRDEAMPLATDSTDVAGAIATPTTTARYGTGDPDSLLPRADDDYLRVTATTAQDLAVMAPGVPVAATRDLPGDPELDADLAAWNDAASPRPKLHLLGPIRLEAAGERSADVEARPAYFAELAAYLACHPRGVTPDQVATAFGLQHNTLHTRINSLRRWLGKNATTGGWYLPDSTTTEARKARGQALYQLDGLLCDAELFRRLRTQGQARGPLGIDSLVTALGLVEGKPYDQPRKGGYAWLLESPEDQYLTAAVVDVAHIVATHALAEGDPALATWAAEIAIGAAPYEDRPRLDEAAAQKALGNVAEAERILNCDVFDRTDDDRPPLDPSPRTLEVASRISPDPRRRR
jgi:LysM repeat protein